MVVWEETIFEHSQIGLVKWTGKRKTLRQHGTFHRTNVLATNKTHMQTESMFIRFGRLTMIASKCFGILHLCVMFSIKYYESYKLHAYYWNGTCVQRFINTIIIWYWHFSQSIAVEVLSCNILFGLFYIKRLEGEGLQRREENAGCINDSFGAQTKHPSESNMPSEHFWCENNSDDNDNMSAAGDKKAQA